MPQLILLIKSSKKIWQSYIPVLLIFSISVPNVVTIGRIYGISKKTDNFFQIFFMGNSWVAVTINNNITTRASREMTSRKNIKIFDFNGVNVANHWHVTGEVFAISDCLVVDVSMWPLP